MCQRACATETADDGGFFLKQPIVQSGNEKEKTQNHNQKDEKIFFWRAAKEWKIKDYIKKEYEKSFKVEKDC